MRGPDLDRAHDVVVVEPQEIGEQRWILREGIAIHVLLEGSASAQVRRRGPHRRGERLRPAQRLLQHAFGGHDVLCRYTCQYISRRATMNFSML
jgi:hypothetical protein